MVQERGMFEHPLSQVSHFSSCQFCEGARKFRSDILKGLANRPIEVFDLKNVTAVRFMDKNGRSGLPEVQELLKNETFLLGDNPAGGLHTERLYRNECIVKVSRRYCININGTLTCVDPSSHLCWPRGCYYGYALPDGSQNLWEQIQAGIRHICPTGTGCCCGES
jgi:hypothetical protein